MNHLCEVILQPVTHWNYVVSNCSLRAIDSLRLPVSGPPEQLPHQQAGPTQAGGRPAGCDAGPTVGGFVTGQAERLCIQAHSHRRSAVYLSQSRGGRVQEGEVLANDKLSFGVAVIQTNIRRRKGEGHRGLDIQYYQRTNCKRNCSRQQEMKLKVLFIVLFLCWFLGAWEYFGFGKIYTDTNIIDASDICRQHNTMK